MRVGCAICRKRFEKFIVVIDSFQIQWQNWPAKRTWILLLMLEVNWVFKAIRTLALLDNVYFNGVDNENDTRFDVGFVTSFQCYMKYFKAMPNMLAKMALS